MKIIESIPIKTSRRDKDTSEPRQELIDSWFYYERLRAISASCA